MTEADFVSALLDPSAPVPAGLVQPNGFPARERFSVYRNTVAMGLTDILQAGFPAILKLVGPAFFSATAGRFLRKHPPKTRIMMLYGTEFAQFLRDDPALADYPYLADVARLEIALRESYHAEDAQAVPVASLAALSEADLLSARPRLAPATRVVCSDWPVLGLWRATMQDGPAPVAKAETVLILRPDFDPVPNAVSRAMADFVACLTAGQTVAMALSGVGAELDLAETLTLLITGKAIVGIDR